MEQAQSFISTYSLQNLEIDDVEIVQAFARFLTNEVKSISNGNGESIVNQRETEPIVVQSGNFLKILVFWQLLTAFLENDDFAHNLTDEIESISNENEESIVNQLETESIVVQSGNF